MHRKYITSTSCSTVLPTASGFLQFDGQDAGIWLVLPQNRSFDHLKAHQDDTEPSFQA